MHDSRTAYTISSRDQRIMPVYLISRIADPLFALTMGVTAALTRIRRDQREKNPERASEISYGTVVQTGGQRLQRWWNGDFQDV
ncbi:hypothetical protein N7508_001773 [Penicillium antarcticum]|uniref:uncharacterized protein n=1 Tax=Penicillium antarcticum TaxID=416450 RepID=UPI002396B6F3|nr:uncharacterized protein N7508_001773 [Penicillium antarcticum]KAJ5317265.1 hypothetical protein N7508_001773 [Penicillium antarcticum]